MTLSALRFFCGLVPTCASGSTRAAISDFNSLKTRVSIRLSHMSSPSRRSHDDYTLGSLWTWMSSPARGSNTPPRRASNEPPSPQLASQENQASSSRATPSERLAAGSAAVRLDWASSSSTEEHVPKLLDSRGAETQSSMLSPFALRQLAGSIPARFAYADWRLLYSTAVHGISLNTFFSKSSGCGCCLLAIKDGDGNVFGGFCTECVCRTHSPSRPPNKLSVFACVLCASADGPWRSPGGVSPRRLQPFTAAARPSFSPSSGCTTCHRFRWARTRRPTRRCMSTDGQAPTRTLCSRRVITWPWAVAATLASSWTRTCCTAPRGRVRPSPTCVYAGSGRAACRGRMTPRSASTSVRCSRSGAWTTPTSRGDSTR